MLFALKLTEPCKHCGAWLQVLFKRDMSGGPLMSAIVHPWESPNWKPVTGFEDLLKLEVGK